MAVAGGKHKIFHKSNKITVFSWDFERCLQTQFVLPKYPPGLWMFAHKESNLDLVPLQVTYQHFLNEKSKLQMWEN